MYYEMQLMYQTWNHCICADWPALHHQTKQETPQRGQCSVTWSNSETNTTQNWEINIFKLQWLLITMSCLHCSQCKLVIVFLKLARFLRTRPGLLFLHPPPPPPPFVVVVESHDWKKLFFHWLVWNLVCVWVMLDCCLVCFETESPAPSFSSPSQIFQFHAATDSCCIFMNRLIDVPDHTSVSPFTLCSVSDWVNDWRLMPKPAPAQRVHGYFVKKSHSLKLTGYLYICDFGDTFISCLSLTVLRTQLLKLNGALTCQKC